MVPEAGGAPHCYHEKTHISQGVSQQMNCKVSRLVARLCPMRWAMVKTRTPSTKENYRRMGFLYLF